MKSRPTNDTEYTAVLGAGVRVRHVHRGPPASVSILLETRINGRWLPVTCYHSSALGLSYLDRYSARGRAPRLKCSYEASLVLSKYELWVGWADLVRRFRRECR
jgi:hypothetical protein